MGRFLNAVIMTMTTQIVIGCRLPDAEEIAKLPFY